MKIWFEPHSTSLDNEAGRSSGWNDVDLSELGLQQSQDLIERSRQRNLDAIFVSDLQRAVKSAIPTADALKIPLYIDRRLGECDYGDFTLKPKTIVDPERTKRIKEPFPNGESYEQCMKRMGEFFEGLKRLPYQRVMIIGHRATHYGLDVWIDGKTIEECLAPDFKWQPGWEYELK